MVGDLLVGWLSWLDAFVGWMVDWFGLLVGCLGCFIYLLWLFVCVCTVVHVCFGMFRSVSFLFLLVSTS